VEGLLKEIKESLRNESDGQGKSGDKEERKLNHE
jgi:hypothetical protein